MDITLRNLDWFKRTSTSPRPLFDLDPLIIQEAEYTQSSSTTRPADEGTFELVRLDKNKSSDPSDSHKIPSPKAWWKRPLKYQSWRLGLHAGLYASIIVLISNIVLLSYGLGIHDNTPKGIATIAKGGQVQRINTISTAYHVLINIMSTILLTSSNYAMQILCAPTRHEIDRAHAQGQWLEIGIMSLHNLRHIDRKRVAIWLLLACSSLPLHLFYNSSIYGAIAAQDYKAKLIISYDEITPNTPGWKLLSNKNWQRIYSTSWVPGYSDLHLLVDRVAYDVEILKNWTYALSVPKAPCGASSTFSIRRERLTAVFSLDWNNGTVWQKDASRAVVDMVDFQTNKAKFPSPDWRGPYDIKANMSQSLRDHIQVCGDENDGWLLPTGALHVRNALAKESPYANRVQIAIPFLSIVILANVVKVVAIWCAIRMRCEGHVITTGDAVASFLQRPEQGTRGKCTFGKEDMLHVGLETGSRRWKTVRKPMVLLGGKRLWSGMIIITVFSLSITALILATNPNHTMSAWGTASSSIIRMTSRPFNAQGILLVAFIANLPQAGLSLTYFSLNRICTSICFATEWNQYAVHKKGLRVTRPTGKQRSTHFLQLPLRWAVPLTVMSGVLHWLLSQSLFLVRKEVRTREGELYPGSRCACGYSALSLMAFVLVFLVLLWAVFYMLLRDVDVRLPPARHCSLAIRAACHPPEGDVEAWVEEVGWGVTVPAGDGIVGHCTFTSWPITGVEPGGLYA